MEISEYLAQATRGIRSATRAQAVRDELHAHLSLLADRSRAQGASEEEALRSAMQALGDPGALGAALADPAFGPGPQNAQQAVAGALCLAAGFLSFLYPPWLAGVLLAGAVYAFLRATPDQRRAPLRATLGMWRRHPFTGTAMALSGLYIGSEPVWGAGIHSPWPFAAFTGDLALPLLLAAAAAIVISLYRDPRAGGAVVGVAAVSFFLCSLVSALVLWRLYPAAPGPSVDWFPPPGSYSLQYLVYQDFLFHPAEFTSVCFFGSAVLAGIFGAARQEGASRGMRLHSGD